MDQIIEKLVRWRVADEQPNDWYAPVVYITKNGKIGTLKNTVGWYGGQPDKSEHFSDWPGYVRKYAIKFWTYQSNLLPDAEQISN